MVIYEGIFFDEAETKKIREKEKIHLEVPYPDVHCTFKFKPHSEELFDELLNKEFELTLIGYACDGENSGFEVQIPDELKKYYISRDLKRGVPITPHITISLGLNAKPVNTKNLDFIPLDEPIHVKGKFGYWVADDKLGHLSYDRVKNK